MPSKLICRGACSHIHGADNEVDEHKDYENKSHNDQERVRVGRLLAIHAEFVEVHLSHPQVRVLLQALAEVEHGLFVFLQGLVDLPQREVLQPRVVV